MAPKKRRAQNNKENIDENEFDPLSIETIVNEHLPKFDEKFCQEYQSCEKRIEQKLIAARQEFERYLQVHESQTKLARLLDKEIARIQQQQTGRTSQEMMNKTADLMNASLLDSSTTKTYLIGELKVLPREIAHKSN